MKPDQHKAAIERLSALLATMDLPDHRRRPQNRDGLRWLAKCLAERNAGHANYAEVSRLLADLGHPISRTRSN